MLVLTKPPVSTRESEAKVQELLNEYFKTHFTGAPHAAPLGEVTFPLCDLFFNQTQLPDPAGKPQIHTVFTDLRSTERWISPNSIVVTSEATITIYVRVANQGADANLTDFQCRSVADNVKEIFESQYRYALAQKGIQRPNIARGPTPIQSTGFQARMLVVNATIRYIVPREERSDAPPIDETYRLELPDTYEGDLHVYSATAKTIIIDGLVNLAGRFDLAQHSGEDGLLPFAESIEFPLLASVTDSGLSQNNASLRIAGSELLATISLPSLVTVGRSLIISNLPQLQTLSLPLLANVTRTIAITNNPLLTTIEFPALEAWPRNFSLYGNALDENCINSLITFLDGLPSSLPLWVDLSGGTNAAPTGAALAIADSPPAWKHN